VAGFKKQAESFGMKSSQATVHSIEEIGSGEKKFFRIHSDAGDHDTIALIAASGAQAKKLGVAGEVEFTGKGVSYCATCDGPFFREMDVVVIGGGDTAVEEALYLTRFASKVTIVHRRDRLRSARILQERAAVSGKIDFVMGSVVHEIKGTEVVTGVRVEGLKDGKETLIPCRGVFVFVGWRPNTGFLEGKVEDEDGGGIKVDSAMRTSVPGIFACGDCTSKVLHQVVTAAGDGATAAFSSQKYVEEFKGMAY